MRTRRTSPGCRVDTRAAEHRRAPPCERHDAAAGADRGGRTAESHARAAATVHTDAPRQHGHARERPAPGVRPAQAGQPRDPRDQGDVVGVRVVVAAAGHPGAQRDGDRARQARDPALGPDGRRASWRCARSAGVTVSSAKPPRRAPAGPRKVADTTARSSLRRKPPSSADKRTRSAGARVDLGRPAGHVDDLREARRPSRAAGEERVAGPQHRGCVQRRERERPRDRAVADAGERAGARPARRRRARGVVRRRGALLGARVGEQVASACRAGAAAGARAHRRRDAPCRRRHRRSRARRRRRPRAARRRRAAPGRRRRPAASRRAGRGRRARPRSRGRQRRARRGSPSAGRRT